MSTSPTSSKHALSAAEEAELKLFEGEAHLSLPINHAEEVLKHLLQGHTLKEAELHNVDS